MSDCVNNAPDILNHIREKILFKGNDACAFLTMANTCKSYSRFKGSFINGEQTEEFLTPTKKKCILPILQSLAGVSLCMSNEIETPFSASTESTLWNLADHVSGSIPASSWINGFIEGSYNAAANVFEIMFIYTSNPASIVSWMNDNFVIRHSKTSMPPQLRSATVFFHGLVNTFDGEIIGIPGIFIFRKKLMGIGGSIDVLKFKSIII